MDNIDFSNPAAKTLFRNNGPDAVSTREIQQMLSACEGCETVIVGEHVSQTLTLRGPCTVTINRD